MAPSSVQEPAQVPASRKRILLVEDDPDAALFATHILTRRGGFEVTHTSDPRAALALAAEQSWDLVLTDLDLPNMTGLEMLAVLRQILPGLPVVLVTAEPRDAWPASADGCGPDVILAKPVLASDLLAALSAVLLRGWPRGRARRRPPSLMLARGSLMVHGTATLTSVVIQLLSQIGQLITSLGPLLGGPPLAGGRFRALVPGTGHGRTAAGRVLADGLIDRRSAVLSKLLVWDN